MQHVLAEEEARGAPESASRCISNHLSVLMSASRTKRRAIIRSVSLRTSLHCETRSAASPTPQSLTKAFSAFCPRSL